MPVCKVCKESKAIRDMRMWGENVTETCLVCYEAKKAGKKTAPEGAPPAAPSAPTAAPPKPAIAPTEIVIEASLGFRAVVDGDNLIITQANHTRENDDDNHEAGTYRHRQDKREQYAWEGQETVSRTHDECVNPAAAVSRDKAEQRANQAA